VTLLILTSLVFTLCESDSKMWRAMFSEDGSIALIQYIFGCPFYLPEINQQTVLSHLPAGSAYLNLPVMPVQVLTSAFNSAQLVCGGKLVDDFEFIHPFSSLIGLLFRSVILRWILFHCRACVLFHQLSILPHRPAALTTPSVDDNPRTTPVRTQYPVVKIKFAVIIKEIVAPDAVLQAFL
jgi:hypothetical protein